MLRDLCWMTKILLSAITPVGVCYDSYRCSINKARGQFDTPGKKRINPLPTRMDPGRNRGAASTGQSQPTPQAETEGKPSADGGFEQ